MADAPDVNVEYVYWAEPSCVAGTAATAYTKTALPGLATVWLWSINVRIPPGHSGYTGIAIIDSGSFILPYSQATPAWLIGDNDDLTFPYGQETGSNVQAATYNTGTYNHGWQLRFVYTPMSALEQGGGEITITPGLPEWLSEIGANTPG